MKSYREVIIIESEDIEEIVNITHAVSNILDKSGIRQGFALVFPHHTSSAVYISDSDYSLTDDLRRVLENAAPADARYAHNETDPKLNAHAHLRATLVGHHITVPVTDGLLDLGVYQTMYYAEFDGRRPKEIVVKIIGE